MLRSLAKHVYSTGLSGCKALQTSHAADGLPGSANVASLRCFVTTSTHLNKPGPSKEAAEEAKPDMEAGEQAGTSELDTQALLDESEAQLAETQVKLEACHKDNEEMKTRVLRTMADMENLRTRTTNQVAEAKLFAVQGFAKSILEVADNLERAKASVPAEMVSSESTADREVLHKNLDQLRTGVVLTEKILLQVFKQSGLGRIETEMGAEFDPNLHNALFEVPTDDVPAGCVCTVTKTGYTLNGRVIRAADVGVARPATE